MFALPVEIMAWIYTMDYWQCTRSVNPAIWVTLFLFIVISINLFGVRVFGETEFLFSLIKLIAITTFVYAGISITLTSWCVC